MTWTAPVDRTTGTLVTAAMWNQMLGVTGNIAETAVAKVTTAGDIVYASAANTLARLGIGSSDQALFGGASAPAWAAPPTPWFIHVDPRLGGDSNINWATYAAGTSGAYAMYQRSSGAQNDEIVFNNLFLSAGTWKVVLSFNTGTDRGIYSVQFDAVEKGTIDGYNAVGGSSTSSVSGIAVAASGRVALKLKMATKNASSTSYYGYVGGIDLRRTA